MHENDDLPLDSVDSVVNGSENEEESNGQDNDPDQGTAFVDSKEDMFVDAPEELNFDTSRQNSLTIDNDDNGELGSHSNNEKDGWEKELAGLQEQLKLLTGDTELKVEDGNTVEIVTRVSEFLKTAKEERIHHDDAVSELRGIISGKDDEIADLTTRISELSSSHSVSEPGHQPQNEEQLEAATDKILLSLSTVFGQEELLYGSPVSEKLAHLENRVSFLSAKYTEFYYGADQLRKCLSSDGSDPSIPEDFGSALGAACSELLELKQKEADLLERLSHLEDENRKLVEQVDRDREMTETVRTELSKTKADLEQEKTRCTNTKEKLSMAVTKGKALVQNRDALKHQLSEKTTELENRLTELQEKKSALETSEFVKGQLEQSLAEKTDELEKCYTDLHDKSVSLEAFELTKKELEQSLAEKTKELEECMMKLQEMSTELDGSELIKGELVKSDTMVASYQEMISVKSSIIENIGTILSDLDRPEEGQSSDIIEKVRSLAEERKELKSVSQEYNRLKDLNFSIDFPEEVSQSSLETRLTWLRESFSQAKDEVRALQNQIEGLSMSLSAETEEKNNLRKELDDLTFSLKEIEETTERDSLEREKMVRRLVEISGLMTEGVEYNTSDVNLLVDRSFDKIGKQITGESSYGSEELFESFQSLLYVRDQELSLCKEMLGEEMLVSLQVCNLSNQLKTASQELAFVKEEKIALETDLERSEEKSSLLREKLSMAIKKGKGLVQDREKLKTQLDEKNSEIEKLVLNLQQLGGTVDSYKDQINLLSRDLESKKELETELDAIKEERDQLKQTLSLNDTLFQNVMKSVENMQIPVDLASEDPSEKIDRLAGFVKEVQLARAEEQEELEKVKEEASSLASKLAEAHIALKLVEDALSTADGNIDRLTEENRQVQAAKESVELELQKAVGEASSLASQLDETLATRNTLEATLMQAEKNISDIISEKEEAQSRTATAETELDLVQEEVSNLNNRLAEAHSTIEALRTTLTQTESNMDSLSKQIEDDKVVISDLKNELEKLKNEADFERSKMADSSLTIRSLEDALMKAENSLSALQGEMVKAEVEISTLSSKLNICMEEIAGSSGNSQSKSLEIIPYLDNLQMLLKDPGLISRVNEFLERKYRSLRDMDVIASGIIKNCGEKGILAGEMDNAEGDSSVAKSLLGGLDDSLEIELENSQGNAADEDEISSSLRKIAEGVKLRNSILEKNFEGFSTSIDTLLTSLMENLTAARADMTNVLGRNVSLEEQVRSAEDRVREQENTISALQKDSSSLIDVCGEAASKLQSEVKNDLLELVQFQENVNGGETESTEHPHGVHVSEAAQRVKELSFATEKACATLKLFEKTSNTAAAVIRDVEKRLEEASAALESVVSERDLNQAKVSSAEAKVESMEAFCQDLQLQLESHKVEEEKWHEKEAELSTLYDKLSSAEAKVESTEAYRQDLKLQLESLKAEEEKWHEKEAELYTLYDKLSSAEAKVESTEAYCQDLKLQLESLKAEEKKWHEKEAELSTLYDELSSAGAKVESTEAYCQDLKQQLESLKAKEEKWHEKEAELSTLYDELSSAGAKVESTEAYCQDLKQQLESLKAEEEKWHEKEAELSTLYDKLSMQEQESKGNLIPATDMRALFDKMNGIEVPSVDSANNIDPRNPYDVKKLFAIVDSVTEMQDQIDLLSYGKKELSSALAGKDFEIQGLKEAAEAKSTTDLELAKTKTELSNLISGLEKLLGILAGNDPVVDPNMSESWTLLQALERKITSLLLESESSKSRVQELGLKLAGSEKFVDKLSLKVKEFESKAIQPDIIQERSIFEAPSTSEISEIEDKGALGKISISGVPTAAQVRTARKGSTDHLAISIDSESEHLMNDNETAEDKGHVFKSLNMSGLIPTQGKMIADRVDGIWVSGGRVLMSRPQARLGLMVYSLLLHLWLLASIL